MVYDAPGHPNDFSLIFRTQITKSTLLVASFLAFVLKECLPTIYLQL